MSLSTLPAAPEFTLMLFPGLIDETPPPAPRRRMRSRPVGRARRPRRSSRFPPATAAGTMKTRSDGMGYTDRVECCHDR